MTPKSAVAKLPPPAIYQQHIQADIKGWLQKRAFVEAIAESSTQSHTLTMNHPTLYPSQQAYSHFSPQSQQLGGFPISPAGPQHLQQTPRQLYQQFQQQHAGLVRPQSQGQYAIDLTKPGNPNSTQAQPVERPGSQEPRAQSATRTDQQPSNQAGNSGSTPRKMLQQGQRMPDPMVAASGPIQNTAQVTRSAPQQTAPTSPQSSAREKARVTVLLEINAHLLQEVVALQAQGKAGVAPSQTQQSPTSPTSATDSSHSLHSGQGDPSKPIQSKPASQEYAECMRRLQANLSYLAAIADAKKKVTGTLPTGPAIMVPPPHLPSVQDLYQRLNGLFPDGNQSIVNKAMGTASSQMSKGPQAIQSPG